MALAAPASRLRARLHDDEAQFYAALTGSDYDRMHKVYVEHRRLLRVLSNPLRHDVEGQISADALADFLWTSKLLPKANPERWVIRTLRLFKKLPFVTYHAFTEMFIFDLFVPANGGASALERRRIRAKRLRAARKRRCICQPDRANKRDNKKKVTPKVKKSFPNLPATTYNASTSKPAASAAMFGAQGRLHQGDRRKPKVPANKAPPPSPQAPQGANTATTKLSLASPVPSGAFFDGFDTDIDGELLRESKQSGFDPRKCKTVILSSRRLTKADFDKFAQTFPFLRDMKWWLFGRNSPQYTSTLNAVLLADSGVRKGTLHNPCGAVVVAEGRLRGVRDEQWRVAA